ncbi:MULTISPECIES: NAD(P)/FAD-dependent oxidoreductase [unclassified Streptomyces]|uniref:FAD-dependent oxidoreductase n=1 Tax=Streptomyces TaxID=1883 RepID=UPI00136C295E|nr:MULTISPECIES: NAD(P)/FAD-dependent oxidoreductase [unclassified Streptomyces]NEA04543.1 FAD-dependent monooxygenase [Streptomyces sp. SID10116]MYY84701.1 NAD(P)-binding protein [Streptomyces sp. SID335]MYZ18463.1 NAD(P)-binding protein [Streptomyces sp. SID337]NDZ90957.1 FAD-dependent monooxygenase [Streptomyces sp. SID10115]NEB46631.1 FAD-dependent monooxygenase [Streptomyces sp. SID339]
MRSRRIAVVGGGPGGLTLARVLHRRGHPVTVLERDPAPDARPPGGTLDLQEGLGQRALDRAGLLPEFRSLSRPEGQAMRILDTDGTVLRDWRPRPEDRANPEIDRGHLRDLLLGPRGAHPLDVRWGRKVTRVVPGTRDGVVVHFADGRRETYDLVVGADGAWSRVRAAVSPVTPHYTGVTFVETSLDDIDTRHPGLARLVGDGSLAVYGVNRALVAQRNSGGHVKVYAQFRAPLDQQASVDRSDIDAVRSDLLALFDGWTAPALDLLRHGTAFLHRPLYVLPVSHTWTHVPGVTLLGDAAHLMPPLGAGANLAMLEGAELAESITTASGPGELDEAVRAFEERMWARAGRWATITTAGLERLVGPDPAEAVALFDEVQQS